LWPEPDLPGRRAGAGGIFYRANRRKCQPGRNLP